jgi:hypothetical protein
VSFSADPVYILLNACKISIIVSIPTAINVSITGIDNITSMILLLFIVLNGKSNQEIKNVGKI